MTSRGLLRTCLEAPVAAVRTSILSCPTLRLLLRADDGRAPRVGDIGTVVGVIKAPRRFDRFVVEAVDGAGVVVWEGLFGAHELALADGAV